MRQERIISQQQQPRKTKSGAPALFLCPISLEIMKDPVIVCTGQTYDRPSIEKWIRDGHRSCPITMLHLHDLTLIPNIIVRQLIEAWSASEDAAAAMFGPPIEPAASNNGSSQEEAGCLLWSRAEEAGRSGGGSGAAVDREQVLGLLRSIARGQNVRDSVSSLRAMAKNEIKNSSSSNVCTCIVEAGGALLLASMLVASSDRQQQHEEDDDDACDEVLALLGLLCRGSSRDVVGAVLAEAGALESVVGYLSSSSIASMRMNSAMLLKRLLVTEELRATVGKAPGFFRGLLDLISSSSSNNNIISAAKKSLVKVLQLACSYKPNRSKAVEQGAIGVLVGLLAATTSSSHDARALAAAERALATIELLCTVEQGRRSACGHPAAVATVVRMLLGFSRLCTEHATGCLLLVSQSGPVEVLQVAMRAGARRQLLLLLQSDCTGRAKRKALEMLKLFHAIFFEGGDPGMAVSSDFKNVDLY